MYPVTSVSLQAEQAFPYVFHSVEGHGVVTQRTPVSRDAHTGRYSSVHISGLGSWHSVSIDRSVDVSTAVPLHPRIPIKMRVSARFMCCNLAEIYIGV